MSICQPHFLKHFLNTANFICSPGLLDHGHVAKFISLHQYILLSCQISRRQLDGYTMHPLYLSLLEQQITQKDPATQPYLVHVDTCRYWYIQNPSYSPFLTNPIPPHKNAFCEVLILKDIINQKYSLLNSLC